MLACQSAESWAPTLEARGIVYDDFEAEISTLGYSASGETEHQGFDVAFGATGSQAPVSEGEAGKAVVRFDGGLGVVEFGDLDALEFFGGGRWYVAPNPRVAPYLSAYAVATALDEVMDVSVGTQVGARLGLGLEINVTPRFFFDVGGDYTLALVEAESDEVAGETIDTELTGFAIRIGLGFRF